MKRAFFIAALIVVALSHTLAAQPLNVWSNVGPSSSYSLTIDPHRPNSLYAANSLGIFKSLDSGTTWFLVSQTQVGDLKADFVSPNTLYASSSEGVIKSTDGGATWIPLNSGGGGLLGLSQANPDTIYAGSNDGVRVTTDGGATWQIRALPFTPEFFTFLEVDPQDPKIIYIFATHTETLEMGLFRSSDGGANWSRLHYANNTANVATSSLTIDPADPATLYATTYFGLYKSTDRGSSWTFRGSSGIYSLAIDPLEPSTLYSSRWLNGPVKSTDDGRTWAPFNTGLSSESVWDLVVDRTGTYLFATTLSGIYRTRLRPDPPTVSVSGNVSNPNGQALRNAVVTLTDSLGFPRRVVTGSFGLFSFNGIRANEEYTITVSSKRWRFDPQIIRVSQNLTSLTFVGLE